MPDRAEALEAELRRRTREIALLRETTLAIGSELDLDKVFALIVDHARELIGADTVLLPLIDQSRHEYAYRAGSGTNAEEIVGESLPLDFGVCGWVLKHQRPWWRGQLDTLSDQEKNLWEKEAGTLLLVPLVGRQHFLGGISCINKAGGGEFTESDLHLLELFAGQAAIAIENAMAMERVEQALTEAEQARGELQRVNKRLTAVNQELEYLSLYDKLTGLPNRSLFHDRVCKAMERPGGGGLALLIADIDHFQEINDGLGHEAGDELLRIVARRFTDCLGSTCVIGRMSGDEFAILLPGADARSARETAQALLETLDPTMELAGQDILVRASIGIALYPDSAGDIAALFKYADAAMLAAKRDKSGLLFYDERLDPGGPGRLALARDLRDALDNGEFELYYQPKLELAAGTITGVEALARWRRRDASFVPPDMFIVALEQTGLIQRFTWWAMETALRQRAAWLDRGIDLRIAVNVPIISITDPSFIADLSRLIARHGGQGGITLEITENLFFGDYDRLNRVLTELQSFDIECSIDDFGTGYSSLARLRQLPVAEIKIDRSFVMDMLHSNDDAVIVRSTIELGRNLGLKVVAEGVENAQILQQLYHLRCDSVQGYHIARPLPAPELADFLERSPWQAQRRGGTHSGNLRSL